MKVSYNTFERSYIVESLLSTEMIGIFYEGLFPDVWAPAELVFSRKRLHKEPDIWKKKVAICKEKLKSITDIILSWNVLVVLVPFDIKQTNNELSYDINWVI